MTRVARVGRRALPAIAAALAAAGLAQAGLAAADSTPAPGTPAASAPAPSTSRAAAGPSPAGPGNSAAPPATTPKAKAPAPPPSAPPVPHNLKPLAARDYTGILGKKIVGPDGNELGLLVDVLVDASGRPHAAIIDFGGFLGVGSRKIAVDWRLLKLASGEPDWKISLNLSRAEIQGAPEYVPAGAADKMVGPPPAAAPPAAPKPVGPPPPAAPPPRDTPSSNSGK